MSSERIFIPNRGEITKRIARTAKKMGFKVYGLVAKGDLELDYKDCLDDYFVHDEKDQVLLSVSAVIDLAKKFGCKFIHPGYGFLSENPQLSKLCRENRIHFVGPNPRCLSLCGDKKKCKNFARKFLTTVPSIPVKRKTLNLNKINFPVLVKATYGGGGRGIRIVHDVDDLDRAVRESILESKFFGGGEILLEKYLQGVKHIEFQVVRSSKGEFAVLGTRDCTIQRRHQKIIEEAPGFIPESLYKHTCNKIQEMFEKMGYVGVATVEFLYDGESLFFLEANPRIQVEHTVTEEIFEIDIVETQLLISLKEKLKLPKESKGHSIQLRLNAENSLDFSPSFGRLIELKYPDDCRVDYTYSEGNKINENYDNLIGKIIIKGASREEAIKKAILACFSLRVKGIETNQSLLLRVLTSRKFIENRHATDFLDKFNHATIVNRINKSLSVGLDKTISIVHREDIIEIDLKV